MDDFIVQRRRVPVRSYSRVRFGQLECVCRHTRSFPRR